MGIRTNLLHHGMVIVGLPCSFQRQLKLDEVTGGATTITAGDGSCLPSGNELEGARFLGRHVAQLAARVVG
jgi:NAD(P)H dehydrogenase (quinone)